MKKSIFLFTVIFTTLNVSAKKVKFAVDMTGQIISAFGIHVTGDFQEAAGFTLNWDPASVTLTQEGSTNIYSTIVTIPAFSKYEYRFVNGDQTYESEFVPDESRVGYNFNDNRWLYVDSLANDTTFVGAIMFGGNAPAGYNLIRYKVNMNNALPLSANGIHVGSSNDFFSPTKVRLYSFGDGIFEIINYYQTGTYNFIFFNGNTAGTSETVPGSCSVFGNREITLTKDSVLPAFCFSSCTECLNVSVKEIENTTSMFQAYPNPTKDKFTIQSSSNNLIESISIYNLTGQLIEKVQNINQETYTVSNMKLSSGLYTVCVSNAQKQSQYLKIIVE